MVFCAAPENYPYHGRGKQLINELVRLFAVHAIVLRELQIFFWLMSELQNGMWCAFPLKRSFLISLFSLVQMGVVFL